MLANVNRDLLLYLLIAVAIIGFVVVLSGTVWSIIKAYKKGNCNKVKMIIFTVLSIVIVTVSWFLNFGWIRFIMTFMLIPFIHSIIFFVTNLFTLKYREQSKKLRVVNNLFCFSYLAAYLLLPDGGDVGGMYVFFGLIHNELISNVCYFISGVLFLGNVVLFILQIIQIIQIKKCNSRL